MTTSRKTSLALLSTLAFALAGAPGIVKAQREARPPPPTDSPFAPGRPVQLCSVVLAVSTDDPEKNAHLEKGQWLAFIGPIGAGGPILVIPLEGDGTPPPPPHHWRFGVRVAHMNGDKYLLSGVPVLDPPKHNLDKEHDFDMTVRVNRDGCLTRVEFDTRPGADELTDLHPGHAVVD